jgi:hypothetical protein
MRRADKEANRASFIAIPYKDLGLICGGMFKVEPPPTEKPIVLPTIDQTFLREHPCLVSQTPATRYDPGPMPKPFPMQIQGSGSSDSANIVAAVSSNTKSAMVGVNESLGGQNVIGGFGWKF